jgi:hypothetical protein
MGFDIKSISFHCLYFFCHLLRIQAWLSYAISYSLYNWPGKTINWCMETGLESGHSLHHQGLLTILFSASIISCLEFSIGLSFFFCYHILIMQRGFVVIFPYLHVMYFDQMPPSITFSSLSTFSSYVVFNGFHYPIFIHAYEVLPSYSSPTIYLLLSLSPSASFQS